MIKISGLSKQFDATDPQGFKLGPIDLTVAGGAVIGVLGKNGAGKTTLFELITGSLDATSGEARLDEVLITPDVPQIKRQMGYMPQSLKLPRWVSANETLMYLARLHNLSQPEAVVERTIQYWDIHSYRHLPVAACSGGMQKRTGLAIATLHNPKVLILDEPFEALDLLHIKALEAEIRRRADRGLITIVSTHIADYAARLCTRIVTLEDGRFDSAETLNAGWQSCSREQKKSAIEGIFLRLTGDTIQDLHP